MACNYDDGTISATECYYFLLVHLINLSGGVVIVYK